MMIQGTGNRQPHTPAALQPRREILLDSPYETESIVAQVMTRKMRQMPGTESQAFNPKLGTKLPITPKDIKTPCFPSDYIAKAPKNI
jgi:hypothetical protein